MKTTKAKKYPVRLPKGWTLEEVEDVRKYYDAQTDEQGAAEDEALYEPEAVMIVPRRLVPRFRKMIAEHYGKRPRPTRRLKSGVKRKNIFPKGWDEARVRRVISYYDHQTEEQAAAEIEAAFNNPDNCTITVPKKLLPKIRKLLAAAR